MLELEMSQSSEGNASMEGLSALVDGELGSDAGARACAQWREDPQARAHWHAYALIGDVMRSDDLASTVDRDCAFLARLRVRLADEPVVLAPAELPAPVELPAVAAVAAVAGSRRAWRTPVAVAAGFVVVAGALVATSVPGSLPFGGSPATVAQAGDAPAVASVATAPSPSPLRAVSIAQDTAPVRLNGQLIRDARLDEYLSVHKKFGGSSAPGVPSGFLRNAAAEAPAR
jgi:sigma-E factor negative regulatory protein RseA